MCCSVGPHRNCADVPNLPQVYRWLVYVRVNDVGMRSVTALTAAFRPIKGKNKLCLVHHVSEEPASNSQSQFFDCVGKQGSEKVDHTVRGVKTSGS